MHPQIFHQLNSREGLWLVQKGRAIGLAQRGQADSAIRHYLSALDTLESLRGALGAEQHKLSFFFSRMYVYDELVQLLHRQAQRYPAKNDARQALEIFERKQGRVFLEQMGHSGSRQFAGTPKAIIEQDTRLSSEIAQTARQLAAERAKPLPERDQAGVKKREQELQNLQRQEHVLRHQLRSDYPGYHALRYPQPVTVNELQNQVLRPDEIVLVYSVMPKVPATEIQDRVLLWLVSKQRFELFELPVKPAQLKKRVDALYRVLAARGKKVLKQRGKLRGRKLIHPGGILVPWESAAYELYQDLIPESVRPLLKNKTLYVVPTGVLYTLPFEALVTENRATPRYLIEDNAVSYLSSASLLKILRDARARRKAEPNYPLLAFADPIYHGKPSPRRSLSGQALDEQFRRAGLRQLPETQVEARAIAKVLNAPQQSKTGVKTLQLRGDARRPRVFDFNDIKYLDDYRYLLFAMHGVFTKVDQLTQPALALSYPDRDGYLTMADIFGLQLNADFIMLSACNTGSGDPAGAGEGIRGLTGAFMYAGTPAVAVTLWSVETHSAKALSTEIFRQLHRGLPVAEALRTAKLKMLRGESDGGDAWRHPFFWAAFTGFGDGSITRYSRDNPRQVAELLAATGYFAGRPETADWAELREALKALQRDLNLPPTGKVDDALWEKLRQVKVQKR